MWYYSEQFLRGSRANNAITFQERKKLGSDTTLRIPPLIQGGLADVCLASNGVAYEYVNSHGELVSSVGLASLVQFSQNHKDIYIIDNHNHAFAMWWKSCLAGTINRGSHLIHIDQHSDLNDPIFSLSFDPVIAPVEKGDGKETNDKMISSVLQRTKGDGGRTDDWSKISGYSNEVLTIADFIKPAKKCGLIRDYQMILTEYSLYNFSTANVPRCSIILDIDLDFRSPDMSITEYSKTIHQVRNLIFSDQIGCVTIATSPTYIDQELAIDILHDLLQAS